METKGSGSAPLVAAAAWLMLATLLLVLPPSSAHEKQPAPVLRGAAFEVAGMVGNREQQRQQWTGGGKSRLAVMPGRKLLLRQQQQGDGRPGSSRPATSSRGHDHPYPHQRSWTTPAPAPAPGNRTINRVGGVASSYPARIGFSCSKDDVAVYQSPTDKLPSGIPTYTVRVMNVCASGCAVSRVHVSCGWYSSAKLVNPKVFRRLRFDDCLLNDGQPIPVGGGLVFTYANTYRYPLVVTALSCEPNT